MHWLCYVISVIKSFHEYQLTNRRTVDSVTMDVTLGCKKGHIKRSMVMFFNNPVAKDSLFERFSELQLGYKPRQPC